MSEATVIPAPTLPPALGRTIQQGRAILAQPAVRRSLPVVLGTLALAAAAIFYILLRTPDQRTLFAGLPESDKAAVAEALQKGNFDVSIDDLGNVQVPSGDYHKAKLLLASQGLPKAAPTGYDLLNDMPMGTSRAMEQARLKQSQESELSNSVAEIAGVESARVHLALPEQSVFVREQTPPSASVFVKLAPGRALGEAQVRSIVNLVASSVPGLPTDRVSVVDQTGALLTNDGPGDNLGESRRRLDLQARMEANYRERLVALLTPVVGSENFTTDVHLDLDFTEMQETREAYDKDNAVVRSEQGTNQSEGGAAAPPKGVPGALTNVAPPAAQVTPPAPAGDANAAPGAAAVATGPKNETYTRNYEIGKQVSVIRNPVGQLKRVSVSIVLRDGDKAAAFKPKDIQAIEKLAQSSVGFDAKRGDIVNVTARPFTDIPAPTMINKVTDAAQDWLPGVGKVLAALAVFAFAFFKVLKPFLNNAVAVTNGGNAAPGQAVAISGGTHNIGDERTIELLRQHLRPRSAIPPELLSTANSYDDKIAIVRMFVAEDTARASNVVKNLLRAENAPAAE